MVYPRWKEWRRLRQIDRIKGETLKQEGMRLEDALKLLERENPSFVILYTGNTKGYLETCGCFAGQSGGVARRATVIRRLREKIPILLLDAGGILQGNGLLDKSRTKVYLESMEKMGYDAVCPKGDEMDFISKSSLTLISTNIHTMTVPSILKRVGGVQIGILGLSKPESAYSEEALLTPLQEELKRIRGKTEIVVLLSNLSASEIREVAQKVRGIDYIISNEEGEPEKLGSTYLLFSSPKGKKLGFLTVRASPMESFSESILLTNDVPDDTQIRAILNQFYKAVAQERRFQRDETLLPVNGNGYVGSEECRSCHAGEYEQWSQTPHAGAFFTLLRKNRHFYPDCVICHTTGFGYESGYQIGGERSEKLVGVGCESCHGPGKRHAFNPTQQNVSREVKTSVCVRCHTSEHSPSFDRLEGLLRSEVDHSQRSIGFEQLIAQHSRGALKPQLELFVMSFCPFGVAAEKKLLPKLRDYTDRVDFRLYFIAEKVEKSEKEEELPFKSLHGKTEVMEDIRQVVISKIYPEKLFDYLLCRADKLKESWVKCARRYGIDVSSVNKLIEDRTAMRWFEENIKRSEEMGIKASPTLLLNGQRISIGGALSGSNRGSCE